MPPRTAPTRTTKFPSVSSQSQSQLALETTTPPPQTSTVATSSIPSVKSSAFSPVNVPTITAAIQEPSAYDTTPKGAKFIVPEGYAEMSEETRSKLLDFIDSTSNAKSYLLDIAFITDAKDHVFMPKASQMTNLRLMLLRAAKRATAPVTHEVESKSSAPPAESAVATTTTTTTTTEAHTNGTSSTASKEEALDIMIAGRKYPKPALYDSASEKTKTKFKNTLTVATKFAAHFDQTLMDELLVVSDIPDKDEKRAAYLKAVAAAEQRSIATAASGKSRTRKTPAGVEYLICTTEEAGVSEVDSFLDTHPTMHKYTMDAKFMQDVSRYIRTKDLDTKLKMYASMEIEAGARLIQQTGAKRSRTEEEAAVTPAASTCTTPDPASSSSVSNDVLEPPKKTARLTPPSPVVVKQTSDKMNVEHKPIPAPSSPLPAKSQSIPVGEALSKEGVASIINTIFTGIKQRDDMMHTHINASRDASSNTNTTILEMMKNHISEADTKQTARDASLHQLITNMNDHNNAMHERHIEKMSVIMANYSKTLEMFINSHDTVIRSNAVLATSVNNMVTSFDKSIDAIRDHITTLSSPPSSSSSSSSILAGAMSSLQAGHKPVSVDKIVIEEENDDEKEEEEEEERKFNVPPTPDELGFMKKVLPHINLEQATAASQPLLEPETQQQQQTSSSSSSSDKAEVDVEEEEEERQLAMEAEAMVAADEAKMNELDALDNIPCTQPTKELESTELQADADEDALADLAD